MNNDLFERHSWYFRNALVRANYRNVAKGIELEPIFLVRFFRNLLLGENNVLKNRYMLINPPEEWKIAIEREKSVLASTSEREQSRQKVKGPTSTPTSTPSSTPTSLSQHMLQTNNPLIRNLVRVIGSNQCNTKEMLEGVGLKDRKNFLEYHLNPAISEGYVRLLYPDKPRHPRQKYLLTVKGFALYNEMNKEDE